MKKLSCHCGGVKIDVKVPETFTKVTKCNCSLCKKKGIIMAFVELDDLKVIKGEDLLKLYQYHTKVAKHYFCKICGIYTHHKRRSADAMGVNVGCFDHLTLDNLEQIGKVQGSSLTLVTEKQ